LVSSRIFRLRRARGGATQGAHSPNAGKDAEDLRHRLSSSIDNDTSRDLDQIEYTERLSNGGLRVPIRITDVDLFVPKGSVIDCRAVMKTVTVYSGIRNWSQRC
jgi:exoribonuclease II